jgi:branched-chain amino acid transport system permease protein
MRITIPHLRKRSYMPVAVVVMLAVLPVVGVSGRWLLYIFLFFIYLSIANMWGLLCGYSGLICLCLPAFIGLGGYTLIIGTWVGLPIPLGMIAGTLVAAGFALLISIPVFRLKGIYFAIGTLVVPEALKFVFFLWRPVGGALQGGGAGYVLRSAGGFSTTDIYWFALAIGLASIFIMRFILSSKLGSGLAAIRDNEITAATSGIDVFRLKLYSFVIAALVTGMAGTIFYLRQAYIEPASSFSITWTMIAMVGVVVGGLRTEVGPIFGTIIVVLLHFLLSRYAGYNLIIQGIILVDVMLVAPQGIMGFIRKTRGYRSLRQLASGQ